MTVTVRMHDRNTGVIEFLFFVSHFYEFIAGVQKSILELRPVFYNEFLVQKSFHSFPI